MKMFLKENNGRLGENNAKPILKLETRNSKLECKIKNANWNAKSEIRNAKCSKGFSMTEILITMALILLLAGAGMGGYFTYYKSSLINSDVDNALTLIKYTRFNALKNPTNSDYGVHLDVAKSSLVAFRSAYNPFDTSNKTVELKELRIEDLNLMPTAGITNEILFKNQTGKTDNTGSFVIGNETFTYTFNINSQGIVN